MKKDYIGIEEQDIDDIDTNYFIAYAIFFRFVLMKMKMGIRVLLTVWKDIQSMSLFRTNHGWTIVGDGKKYLLGELEVIHIKE